MNRTCRPDTGEEVLEEAGKDDCICRPDSSACSPSNKPKNSSLRITTPKPRGVLQVSAIFTSASETKLSSQSEVGHCLRWHIDLSVEDGFADKISEIRNTPTIALLGTSTGHWTDSKEEKTMTISAPAETASAATSKFLDIWSAGKTFRAHCLRL
mmetsp:Transcript_71964/g.127183  ORF Transcript_71964/g.127183 Transcript_71964/m.127183 type:complete len:155 (-) Transcript_71964:128-592(-)